MHGDKIKGTELSSTFDALPQLEIKSIANVPLTMFVGFFVTRKGPRTHVIVYSSFVKERVDNEKAGEHS